MTSRDFPETKRMFLLFITLSFSWDNLQTYLFNGVPYVYHHSEYKTVSPPQKKNTSLFSGDIFLGGSSPSLREILSVIPRKTPGDFPAESRRFKPPPFSPHLQGVGRSCGFAFLALANMEPRLENPAFQWRDRNPMGFLGCLLMENLDPVIMV